MKPSIEDIAEVFEFWEDYLKTPTYCRDGISINPSIQEMERSKVYGIAAKMLRDGYYAAEMIHAAKCYGHLQDDGRTP